MTKDAVIMGLVLVILIGFLGFLGWIGDNKEERDD